MTITEFLLARIREDEAAAREAGTYGTGWHWDQGYGEMCNDPECSYGELMTDGKDGPCLLMEVHGYDVTDGWEGAAHIARHDPARVLAECRAKRAIVEYAEDVHTAYVEASRTGEVDTETRIVGSAGWLYPFDMTLVLAYLAAVYADHPAYQEEWKP